MMARESQIHGKFRTGVRGPEEYRRRFQTLWYGFVLFICSAPFPFIFQQVDPNNPFSLEQKKSLFIYFKMAAIASIASYAWIHRKKIYDFLTNNLFLTLYLLLAWLSAAWSLSPYLAARTAFDFTLTIFVCATLLCSFEGPVVATIVSRFFQIVILASIAWAVIFPDQGIHQARTDPFGGDTLSGDWRGVYVHKNIFGQCMAFSVIFFWLRAKGLRQRFSLNSDHAFLAASIMLLFLSRCASGIAVVVLSLLFAYSSSIPRVLRIIVMATAMATFALYVVFMADFNDILFSTLGRDSTFTGRTQGWAYTVSFIEHRWMLGYGFGASNYLSVRMIFRSAVFAAFVDPHNGYLDILVGMGAVGLALFLSWCVPTWIRGLISLRRSGDDGTERIWLVMGLAWLLCAFTEVSPFGSFAPAGLVGFLAMSAVSMTGMRQRPIAAREKLSLAVSAT